MDDRYAIEHDENITIYEINPSVVWYQDGENREIFINNLNKMKFKDKSLNLLLSHTPNPFFVKNEFECDTKADLILSGHNHGGLTPQIIQNHSKKHIGLAGPYCKIMFQNSYGHYILHILKRYLAKDIDLDVRHGTLACTGWNIVKLALLRQPSLVS